MPLFDVHSPHQRHINHGSRLLEVDVSVECGDEILLLLLLFLLHCLQCSIALQSVDVVVDSQCNCPMLVVVVLGSLCSLMWKLSRCR